MIYLLTAGGVIAVLAMALLIRGIIKGDGKSGDGRRSSGRNADTRYFRHTFGAPEGTSPDNSSNEDPA